MVTTTKKPKVDLDALRKPVEAAKSRLAKAQGAVRDAGAELGEAKEAYLKALIPYRTACRQAGAECKYEGGRGVNVSEKVSFLVEKTAKGIRIMVKGKPKTEEIIPLAEVKESIGKVAYSYTDKHVGPREKVGNKGGSLSNRLRAILG